MIRLSDHAQVMTAAWNAERRQWEPATPSQLSDEDMAVLQQLALTLQQPREQQLPDRSADLER